MLAATHGVGGIGKPVLDATHGVGGIGRPVLATAVKLLMPTALTSTRSTKIHTANHLRIWIPHVCTYAGNSMRFGAVKGEICVPCV